MLLVWLPTCRIKDNLLLLLNKYQAQREFVYSVRYLTRSTMAFTPLVRDGLK